jgi:hypothetical protein
MNKTKIFSLFVLAFSSFEGFCSGQYLLSETKESGKNAHQNVINSVIGSSIPRCMVVEIIVKIIKLKWNVVSDNAGVVGYNIFLNNKK